jgi:hypothetical protein
MNWSALEIADVPPGVLTVMSTVPADSAGEVMMQLVVEQIALVAAVAPNLADVAPAMKPVPVTVTAVPLASGPADGLIEVTVGTAS